MMVPAPTENLRAAAGTLIGPGLGRARLCHRRSSGRRARRASCRSKVLSASRLVAKALLELEQGARKVGHHGHREQLCS